MRSDDLTLNSVTKSPKVAQGKVTRLTDFMTAEQRLELQRINYTARSPKKRKFDEIDALAAEILARFGWEAYKAWQEGEIETDRMMKYLLAERARERGRLLNAEAMMLAMIGSCVQKPKKGGTPKGVKLAQKIFKEEAEIAKGVK